MIKIKKRCNFARLIVTFFYVGLISRRAPGTVGSLFSVAICVILLQLNLCGLLLPLTIISFFSGIVCSHIFLIQQKEDTDLDPGYIVIDEACGIFFGCLILYFTDHLSILSITCNFLLFRVFDILKPFPIKKVEAACKERECTAAFGIMIDDIVASVMATGVQLAMIGLD